MLQQKYVYVYMLVVLGMALLAVNNSTLRTQPGQQSMRVTFEQEFESTVVSVSAPVSAPSQSVPTAAMVTVKIEPTQKNVRPNPYDAVRGAGKRDNNKKHASSSTSNSTNNTTRSSVGGTDADRGTPSSSSSTGTNKKKKKTKSSLPPTTYWHNNQTRVVDGIEYRRIPTWMKEYFDWHRLQTTTMNQTNWYHENRKYLIIRCLRGERCGGLSDRIKPMPVFVALAAHTRRILMIRWTKPAPLEEFLVPNEINWTMPAYFAPVMNDPNRHKNVTKYLRKQSSIRQAEDIVVVETKMQSQYAGVDLYSCVTETMLNHTLDRTTTTYKHCNMGKPWLWSADLYRAVYHDVFRIIFRPHPNVQTLIDEKMAGSGLIPGQFIGAHYRSNYNLCTEERIGTHTIQHAAQTQALCAAKMKLEKNYPVYFASDSSTATQAVQNNNTTHYYDTTNTTPISIITSPEETSPLHLEYEGAIEDYYSIFVDLLVMGQSICQLYGQGGFGSFASLLSYNASCYYNTLSCNKGPLTNQLPRDMCCFSEMFKKSKETKKERNDRRQRQDQLQARCG